MQYTEVSCNTRVIYLPTLPAYCCYTTLVKFKLHNNDFVNRPIAVAHSPLKNIEFFHKVIA